MNHEWADILEEKVNSERHKLIKLQQECKRNENTILRQKHFLEENPSARGLNTGEQLEHMREQIHLEMMAVNTVTKEHNALLAKERHSIT